jgi:hypothetical protein
MTLYRRPGSSGQRYFSDMEYANPNIAPSVFSIQKQRVTKPKLAYDARFNTCYGCNATDAARAAMTRQQAAGLQALNLSNLARQQRPVPRRLLTKK